jgi:N-acetylmuramic acid 6-phosphate etherase
MNSENPTPKLGDLPTEAINQRTANLSHLPTREALQLINDEDHLVPQAVGRVLDEISQAVDAIAKRMNLGGRLFYIGAGTSGRLGVVDASECPPTFGTPHEWVQGIIAGGREAMFRSQEGAEDIQRKRCARLTRSRFYLKRLRCRLGCLRSHALCVRRLGIRARNWCVDGRRHC